MNPALADKPMMIGGYDPAFFDQLARIEDKHFWFRARNRLILELTRRLAPTLPRGGLVLEVGCGTGNVLRVLRQACPDRMTIGMELWFEGLRHARNRTDAALVQADIHHWPFSRPVDLVGMFDVLEHIPDDRAVLAALGKCIAPGGCLLLTVPAHQFLWSYFDQAAMHCRRYSAEDLRMKLESAGFQVELLSQFMASLFPLIWCWRRIHRVSEQADTEVTRTLTSNEFRIVPMANQSLTALLGLEASWVARGHRLPLGTSLVAVARKPV